MTRWANNAWALFSDGGPDTLLDHRDIEGTNSSADCTLTIRSLIRFHRCLAKDSVTHPSHLKHMHLMNLASGAFETAEICIVSQP